MKRIEKFNMEFRYYEGDRVEIRQEWGARIILWAPGRFQCEKEMAYADAVIEYGQNASRILDMQDLKRIQEAVEYAREILNKEPGINIPENFILSGNKIPYEKKSVKAKTIPTKEVTTQAIYEMENGKKFIFLGKGSLYRENILGEIEKYNRANCFYCWIEIYDMDGIEVKDGCLYVNTHKCRVDSTATMRKFISKVCDLEYTSIKEYYREKTPSPILVR